MGIPLGLLRKRRGLVCMDGQDGQDGGMIAVMPCPAPLDSRLRGNDGKRRGNDEGETVGMTGAVAE